MKRKLTLLSLIALALFSLSACSKTDPEVQEEKYYTEAQEQVFAIMHGSFKYEFYGITTTVSFGQHYTKPVEAIFKKDGSTRELQGEITITYYDGTSYKRYYRVSTDAKTLTMYDDKQSISLAYVKDFQYVDANTFKWKETKDVLWDTYNRTN